MGRVSEALLGRLHSVFDTRHVPVLALRIRHPDGAGWSIDGFTLEVFAPGVTTSVDLRAVTVREVADHLISLGFEVPHVALGHLSAALLIEGGGHQGDSNGDHVYGYTSLLSVLSGALGRADEVAKADILNALRQMILPQSGGEWADMFGGIFGVPRLGERDALYTARIIEEVRRARSSPAAILLNIKRLTGHDLTLREPWMEVFTLSGSALSGADHLQGAPTYEYHRAQLVSRVGIDWSGPMACAEADRPAGTLMMDPAVHPLALLPGGAMVDGLGEGWRTNTLVFIARVLNAPRLSNSLILSANDAEAPMETARVDVRWISIEPLRAADLSGGEGWLGLWDSRTWDGSGITFDFYPPRGDES